MTSKTSPRGIRNNNPGNIKYDKNTQWQGLANPPSDDGGFCIFIDPVFGIRALAVLLRTYKRKHGICTISGIINRFAPSTENNTKSYINSVCLVVGRGPDTILDVENEEIAWQLIKAIIKHENGEQPYHHKTVIRGIQCSKESKNVGMTFGE